MQYYDFCVSCIAFNRVMTRFMQYKINKFYTFGKYRRIPHFIIGFPWPPAFADRWSCWFNREIYILPAYITLNNNCVTRTRTDNPLRKILFILYYKISLVAYLLGCDTSLSRYFRQNSWIVSMMVTISRWWWSFSYVNVQRSWLLVYYSIGALKINKNLYSNLKTNIR